MAQPKHASRKTLMSQSEPNSVMATAVHKGRDCKHLESTMFMLCRQQRYGDMNMLSGEACLQPTLLCETLAATAGTLMLPLQLMQGMAWAQKHTAALAFHHAVLDASPLCMLA